MKDERLYAKFTLNFAEHPKILPLSDAAFRTLVEMTLWSRQQLTDGFIPRRMVCDEAGAQARAKWLLDPCLELLRNDDENPSLIEVENGYRIHDFAEHQTTKADIEAMREAKKSAGRKGGLASGEARRKQVLKQKRSKTKPETETETNSISTDVLMERPPRAARGARLPDDWTPTIEVVAQMRSEHPNVNADAELDKFCDYWRAKAGRDARKADWNATYRNWIRRAAENTSSPNGSRLSTADQRVAQAQALKNHFAKPQLEAR